MNRLAAILFLLCALCGSSPATDYYFAPAPTGSDGNNGLTPTTPWATFYHIINGGDKSEAGGGFTNHMQGFWNGASGTHYFLLYPMIGGATSNSPIYFVPWVTTNWGITNLTGGNAALIINGYGSGCSWVTFSGMNLISNNYQVSLRYCTNCTFTNCLIIDGTTSPMFYAYSNCVSNLVINSTITNVGSGGSSCANLDGGSDCLYFGNYSSPNDRSDWNMVLGCTLGYNGHAALEFAGSSCLARSNAFINPEWYESTWCSNYTAGQYGTTTNYTWWGGRLVSLGGYSSTNNVVDYNTFDYCGWVPDQPGAIELEGTAWDIVRFNRFSCTAGLAIEFYENTGGSTIAYSNWVYNNSVGLCGSNLTFYAPAGQLTQLPYAEYQAGIGFIGNSNNAVVNNVCWDNFRNDFLYYAGSFTNNWTSVNLTNSNPLWVSEANSLTTFPQVNLLMPDFHLSSSSSPAYATGTWIDWITSATGSGTTFTVTNPAGFGPNLYAGQTAGGFTVPGDVIELSNGQTTTVAVVGGVNGLTITVSPSVSWVQNTTGLAIAGFSGSQPNMGAYDLAGGPPPPPTVQMLAPLHF